MPRLFDRTARRLPFAALALLLTAASACTAKSRPADDGATKTEAEAEVDGRASNPLATSVGPVTIEVLPNFPLLHSGSLPGTLDLLIRLQGEETAEAKRPPLDLAVILDRSGSMSGDKLLAVKQAALDLLKEVRPEDRLTLVSYSSDVTVHTERIVADAAGMTTIRQQLLPIEASGGSSSSRAPSGPRTCSPTCSSSPTGGRTLASRIPRCSACGRPTASARGSRSPPSASASTTTKI